MKRENRYLVLKRKDIAAANLTKSEQICLDEICNKVNLARKARGAKPMDCVIAEKGWPEYDLVWNAIAIRMNPDKPPLSVKLDQIERYGFDKQGESDDEL